MPTLTGTGAVNLTTATNWSPAQIPAPGDDLIIGNATLTIDANFVANTVTFNNASSRIDWASLPRTLTATNGFFVTGNLGASSLAVQSLAAGTLTLVGRWTVTAGTNASGRIASVSGGTLILTTVGASQSAVLCEVTGNTLFSLINLSAGEIQTTGRLLFSTTNTNYYLCNASGGKWTHNSTGTNSFASSALALPVRLELSGAASIDFFGDFELTGGTFVGRFNSGHTGLVRFFGAFIALGMTADRCFVMNSSSSGLYFHGLIDSNTQILNGGSGSVFWQDASATISAGKYLRFNQFITAATNLQIQNFGQLAFLQGVGTVGAPLAIHQRTADALFWAGGNTNFSGRLFPFQTNAPTLPTVQNVAAGTVYGYAGFSQTGTGLILDPAVLASAVDGSVWGKVRPQNPVPGTYGAVSEWAGNVDLTPVTNSLTNISGRIPDVLVNGRIKADATLQPDQPVNITKVGGTTVTGPNDLKANVSGLAQESTVNAVGVALVDVSTRIPDALEGGRIKAVATVSTAGLATEATQLAILAQTSLIGTGAVSVTSPVRQDGTLNDLVVGDAYQQATGRAIQITITGVSAGLQTALATATVHLGFRAFGKSRQSPEFRRYEFAGTIVSIGASTVVRFELTTAQTKAILPGRYDYDIEFRTGGNYLTEVASVEDAPMSWLESSTTLPS